MDTHYRISLELTGTEDRIQLLLTGATGDIRDIMVVSPTAWEFSDAIEHFLKPYAKKTIAFKRTDKTGIVYTNRPNLIQMLKEDYEHKLNTNQVSLIQSFKESCQKLASLKF